MYNQSISVRFKCPPAFGNRNSDGTTSRYCKPWLRRRPNSLARPDWCFEVISASICLQGKPGKMLAQGLAGTLAVRGGWSGRRGSDPMGQSRPQPDDEPKIPETIRPIYQTIVGLTDAFCRKHRDDEYATLSRRLARKRPSPLTNGKPAWWAAEIVRVIAWVNFIGDTSRPNRMVLTNIDWGTGRFRQPLETPSR